MRFFKHLFTIAGCVTIGTLIGCSNPISNQPSAPINPVGDHLIVGPAKNDPYSIESRRLALASLLKKRQSDSTRFAKIKAEDIAIQPNYLYVRFLPQGRKQNGLLQNYDKNLIMFDFPLDHEIIQHGPDISLPDSVKAYYAAVPVNYSFCPEIKYEILKELFLTDLCSDDINTKIRMAKNANEDNSIYSILKTFGISPIDLDVESRRLTGNSSEIIQLSPTGALGKTAASYRGSGRVTYTDNILGVRPVAGARVTIGYYYSWESVKTNSTGNYTGKQTWMFKIDYHLHFDTDDFVFQKQGMIEGPHTVSTSWSPQLTGKWGTVAACFAAAYNYYYGTIDGLCRPHQNSWYNSKLDLEIQDMEFKNDAAAYHMVVPFFAQSITVYLKSSYTHTYISSIEAFSNTTHELAHNAHFQNFKTRYTLVPRDIEFVSYIHTKVKESFAGAAEWRIMNLFYGGNRNRMYGYFGDYTGIGEDLIDANTAYAANATLGTNLDRVRGFSIKQFENAVMESFNFDELRDKLKQKYASGSTTGLFYRTPDYDLLFKFWNGSQKPGASPVSNHTIFSTAKNGDIYSYDASTNRFVKSQGIAVSSAAGPQYTGEPGLNAWHINAEGTVWKLSPYYGWVAVDGCSGLDIGVGRYDIAFATGKNGGIFQYNKSTSSFMPIQGLAVRIDVENDGTAWCVNAVGTVYKLSSGWQSVAGCAAKDIGCGKYLDEFSYPFVFAVGTDSYLYQYDYYKGGNGNFIKTATSGVNRVAISWDGRIWIVTTSGTIRVSSNEGVTFISVPGTDNNFIDIGA